MLQSLPSFCVSGWGRTESTVSAKETTTAAAHHFLPGPIKDDTFFIGEEELTARAPGEPTRAAAGAAAIPNPLTGFVLHRGYPKDFK